MVAIGLKVLERGFAVDLILLLTSPVTASSSSLYWSSSSFMCIGRSNAITVDVAVRMSTKQNASNWTAQLAKNENMTLTLISFNFRSLSTSRQLKFLKRWIRNFNQFSRSFRTEKINNNGRRKYRKRKKPLALFSTGTVIMNEVAFHLKAMHTSRFNTTHATTTTNFQSMFSSFKNRDYQSTSICFMSNKLR